MNRIDMDKVKSAYERICECDAYVEKCKNNLKSEYEKGVAWGYEHGVMRTQFFRTLSDAIIEEAEYDSYIRDRKQKIKKRKFIK